jgi:alpha-L-fucosidase
VGTYAEWYWHDLIQQQNTSGPTWQFHANTYGPNFKYQQVSEWVRCCPTRLLTLIIVQFADMFHAELFNATQWLEIIKASGAQYVVPTSKHHEGFCLWPTDTSWNWNAYDVSWTWD